MHRQENTTIMLAVITLAVIISNSSTIRSFDDQLLELSYNYAMEWKSPI